MEQLIFGQLIINLLRECIGLICTLLITYLYICVFFCCFFFSFYWTIVVLQCSLSFCCTAKWISYSESEVAQSCPTFCDPMDCSLAGSTIHGSFQARILEWVAISFSMYICKYIKVTKIFTMSILSFMHSRYYFGC